MECIGWPVISDKYNFICIIGLGQSPNRKVFASWFTFTTQDPLTILTPSLRKKQCMYRTLYFQLSPTIIFCHCCCANVLLLRVFFSECKTKFQIESNYGLIVYAHPFAP